MGNKYKTLKQVSEALNKGEITSTDLSKEAVELSNKLNAELNCYTTITKELADELSQKSDERRKEKKALSPIDGIPMSIKDVISTKGVRTTAGSKMLENYIPEYNSTVYQKLIENGGVLIGKNNCDPFAFGGSGENSGYGPTKNPICLSKVPGGSSSGSASSVKAGLTYFSIGTDTGGSIRQPASLTGLSGLKLTYGRNSRYGLIAMASSLDTPGILANTVEDIAIVEDIIKGYDEKDSTTKKPGNDFSFVDSLNKDIKDLTIGLPKEYFIDGMDQDVKNTILEAAKKFEKLGCKIQEVSLPHTEYALPVYYLIVPSEISSNMGRYDGFRYGNSDENSKDIAEYIKNSRSVLEDEVKRRIIIGTFALSKGYSDQYYKKAMQVRSLIKKDFDDVYKNVDVILTPTSPTVAWDIGEKVDDPLKMYLADIFTVTANLTGMPGLSINAGYKTITPRKQDVDINGNPCTKLPIGMQLFAPMWREDLLMSLGNSFQKAYPELI
ncbi:MAG: Asp-tRNA(Asn)/Glu-tRNA(Gln) amidotransferase subunit GatA [bacterium]